MHSQTAGARFSTLTLFAAWHSRSAFRVPQHRLTATVKTKPGRVRRGNLGSRNSVCRPADALTEPIAPYLIRLIIPDGLGT
ncbi:uncharacterized protein B0T15DRAFT_540042 [Chaetomium strumarium]|uniref:Uncharacterized protein n=1 Tax=Chaetomium strumarium TaxID=1170767 RepID=A0AAJ0LZH5_9PEZI|nr:hypothetical protein B0T15DRAFT_540042 [Chaetomium strumarium]